MRTYEIDITSDAFEQIQAAYHYIKGQSEQNAEQWLSTLYERVHSLRTMPNLARLIHENDAFEQEV